MVCHSHDHDYYLEGQKPFKWLRIQEHFEHISSFHQHTWHQHSELAVCVSSDN